MKKTTLAAIITAAASLVLFVLGIVFIKWDKQSFDYTPSIMITSLLSLTIVTIVFGLFALLFDKNRRILMIIPVVASLIAIIILSKGVNENLAAHNLTPASSVIDLVSPTNNQPTVFALLLAATFIVSVILVLVKNWKWASIVSITYFVILIISTFSFSSEFMFNIQNKQDYVYLFSSLGTIVLLSAMVVYFVSPFAKNNQMVKKEKPVVENANETEEKVEENKEEAKVEAVAEETKVEEKVEDSEAVEENTKKGEPQDPFKNQYASSESIFDVQDEAEEK